MEITEVASTLGRLSRRRSPPEVIAEALAAIEVHPHALDRYLHFRPGRYTRNCIYRDDRLELLALCWSADTASTVHDHDGQECWFYVQAGAFQIEDFRLVDGRANCSGHARLEHVETHLHLRRSAVDVRTPDNPIHRVSVMPGTGPAVSLHVYSRPVEVCRVFDLGRERCVERRLRYDTVDGRWVTNTLLPPTAPTTLAH